VVPDPRLYKNSIVAPSLLEAFGAGPGQRGGHLVDALLQVESHGLNDHALEGSRVV
jgi:hypothetical protein